MAMDRSFVELNQASTNRIRGLVAQLTDQELCEPVGKDWTVAITLAHMAFWDRRALHVLDLTEQNGKLISPAIDVSLNDFIAPLLAAIPPREAGRLAVEAATAVDRRLENFPEELLEKVYKVKKRTVVRALHRNEHLDAIDASLKKCVECWLNLDR
jgi:uncharacterized damage-inducible protein DinB